LRRLPASQAETSGSPSQSRSVFQLRLIIRGQSSTLLAYGFGGQIRLRSASSSRCASTKAISAALTGGELYRSCWSTIRPGWNTGVAGALRRPSAVQSTCRTSGRVSTSPRSSTIRSVSTRRTRPSLTTSSIWRTASSSPALSMVPRYIVAGWEGSMRESRPLASSRSNMSSRSVASAPASTSSAIPSMICPTWSSGWKWARWWNQASRGRTQRIRSGSTPLSSSQMHASTAVLPEPSTA
jgi:hypothetical protein